MIPKKIHYCWFGRGEKTKLAKKCIGSWKKYCADYEIIEWNEDNFDINYNAYTRYCYENKKWAFLSDYVRLLVINEHGGLYFDTDVEVVKNFDELLTYSAFYGFEDEVYVNTGEGFGAEAGNITVKQMLEEYSELLDGQHGVVGCPILNTQALEKMGFMLDGKMQEIAGAVILPKDFLNPYNDLTGELNKTKNTHSIHWYSKSWLSKKAILRSKLTKPFHRIFGINCFGWMKKKTL